MKIKTKIGIAVVSAYVFSFILTMHWGGGNLFILAVSTTAMFTTLAWLSDSSNEAGANDKKRVVAEYFSIIPGAGHLYLGKRKRSIPFFLAIAVFLFSIYLLFIYPLDVLYIALAVTATTILYAAVMADTDIGRLCDEMGLPYKYPDEETDLPQFYGYYKTTLITSLAVVILTLYFLFFDWNADRNIWIYAITGTAWFIALVVSIIAIRCETHARKM